MTLPVVPAGIIRSKLDPRHAVRNSARVPVQSETEAIARVSLLAKQRRATCWGHLYYEAMDLEFSGQIWYWAGPAPWYFITVPEEQCRILQATSRFVTYGWGMIPVRACINATEWKTSLFPKDGRYIVPVKASVRKAEGLDEGDSVTVRLEVGS